LDTHQEFHPLGFDVHPIRAWRVGSSPVDLCNRRSFVQREFMSQAETIRVRADGGHKTVSLSPWLLDDIDSARWIADQVSEFINSDHHHTSQDSHLRLDFQEIERLNSAWLNELIGINRQARNRGIRVVLLNVQDSVRDVFAVTRIERMFEFSTTVETR
jgi:anti-anti-sigma factor